MRAVALFAVLSLALGTPSLASANGRFPEAQRLLEHPGDPNRLYLTGTYGLLFSGDRGQNWYYVCENAFALEYLEGDPLLEVLPDGTLVGGIHQSLNRTVDCGCTWTATLAAAELENVIDVTLDGNGVLVALVQDLAATPARRVLFESADHGANWTLLSELPADRPNAYTVDVAPSDPSRLYVSATATSLETGVLLVSDDRGATWREHPIPGSSSAVQPYIAAVSSTDAGVVYVRTDHWDDMARPDESAAQDALLVTTDAGATFTEVLRRGAKLLGFALSPDGASVLAGYGDPVIPGRPTNYDDFGIYRASTADHVFERISDKAVGCLRWTVNGLYACIADVPDGSSPDLALGWAANADFSLADANPFTTLLDTKNVKGPLACTGAICEETYRQGLEGNVSVCQALGSDCEADFANNVLECAQGGTGGGGGSGGSGGAGGGGVAGAGSGGAAGSGAGAAGTGAVAGAETRSPPPNGDGGCACRQSGQPQRTSGAWLVLLALGFRKRRSRPRVSSPRDSG